MASLAAFQAPDAVTVHTDSVRQETTYSVAAGAGRIDWVIYATDKLPYDCALWFSLSRAPATAR